MISNHFACALVIVLLLSRTSRTPAGSHRDHIAGDGFAYLSCGKVFNSKPWECIPREDSII